MTLPTLSPAERAALRAQAHAIKPHVLIGAQGLTPAVLAEIECDLNAHSLIKIRVAGDDRKARIALYETLCQTLGAAPIQHIGKLLVLWRPALTPPDENTLSFKANQTNKASEAKKGSPPRRVKIIQRNSSPARRPRRKTVRVLGNERVTTGGLIKKAKKRQVSLKKQFLA
jgi:putative YhbY family RNA-binding protein